MRTEVKKIFRKGASVVVEFEDENTYLQRKIFPVEEVTEEDGKFFVEDVDEGQTYGEEWETIIVTRMGPKAIADLLRRNGIWTLNDYAENSAAVTSTWNQACSANLQQFKEAVLRQLKG